MKKIHYDIYESPSLKGSDKSYHVRVAGSELISFESLKRQIAASSTASEGDVALVFEQVSRILAEELCKGNRVQLDGLGYFSLAIETDPTSNPKSINSSKIRVRGAQFRADKILRSRLTEVSFERALVKRHSDITTSEEVRAILKDYFSSHASINRADFQELMGMTKDTAVRRLQQFSQAPNNIFLKEGAKNSPVYLPNRTSQFWE